MTTEDGMATARRNNTVRLLRVSRRNRPALMMTTALQATFMVVLSPPADAQPLANAHPTGWSVVAGSAAISQTASNTQINQPTQRAAIDWKSFDVGSKQSVTFNQPSSSAVALNRVTGPDPSQIAGQITANGQIVLLNQSGVNFYHGAQVNAAGVMVSSIGASDQSVKNFVASNTGRLVLDQPGNPNAKVDNQGNITVQQAGLAALVAPQVANSGTITARLGHVVLAGAKTATLDLYGDGLLSLDVTNQVAQTPVDKNGNSATALVTNTGVIIADGGAVQLTARAADGIVQNLVQAGGTIRAATIGDQTGTVALNGVGGSIVVEGQLSAPGLAAGTKGGAVEAVSNGNVTVASGARIDASGKAGGGVVAVGTTLARAKGGASVTPTQVAAKMVIQSGATISANATVKGDGGRVTVLSAKATSMAGTIDAKGGLQGGDGGFVEVSGQSGFALSGVVDASAPRGALGTIRIDPRDLTIGTATTDDGTLVTSPPQMSFNTVPAAASGDAFISASAVSGLTGNIDLQASRNLTVTAPITLTTPGQSLTLEAGQNLLISPGGAITTKGAISLFAAAPAPTSPIFPGFSAAGALEINDAVSTTVGQITLFAGTGGMTIAGNVTAPSGPGGTINLTSIGTINQTGGGITGNTLTGSAPAGSASFTSSLNNVNNLGKFTTSTGFSFYDSAPLTVTGAVSTGAGALIALRTDNLTITGSVTAPGGTVAIAPLTTTRGMSLDAGRSDTTLSLLQSDLNKITAGTIALGSVDGGATALTGSLAVNGPITISNAALSGITTGPLTVGAPLNVKGSVSLQTTTGDLNVTNPVVSAANIELQAAHSVDVGTGGNLTASGILYMKANTANNTVNPGDFTIDAPVSGGSVYLSSTSSLGITINQPVTSIGASPLITVACDCVINSALPVVLQAAGGMIEYGPATNGFNQTMLTHDESVFTASVLRFGLSHDPINGTQALAGSLTLGSTAGPISLDGHSLDLNASGSITQPAGSLFTNVATLTGSGGSASLNGGANAISDLGPFTTSGGSLILTAAGPLTITGALNAAGNVSLQTTDSLIVNSAVSSRGDVMLQAGEGLAVLANIIAPGNVALVSDGSSFFGTSIIGILLNAVVEAGGTVFLDGPNLATPQSLGIGLGTAGLVKSDGANPLISIGCDCSFFGQANSLQAIGGTVEIGPRLGHEGSHSLGSSGSSVTASTLVFGLAHDPFTGGPAVDQTLTIDPTGPIGAATLDLEATGGITQTAPLLSLQTLTGKAGSLSLNNPGNQIAFIGPLNATSGSIDFADSIPLAINGALSANRISVNATGTIALQSNITTGTAANGGGALFTVSPDTTGKGTFRAATNVLPLNGSAPTMTVSMPSQGGTVFLTSLNGPSTELVLDLHTADAQGQINVANLNVIGFGGNVAFTDSTVHGLTGSAAAAAATSSPANNPDYLVNGCEIGVGCTSPTITLPPVIQPPNISAGVTVSSGVATIVNELIEDAATAAIQNSQQDNERGVPVLNPMRDLASGPLRDRQDDPDLLLPNVSEKDY
jgi:filamentous hemagglutinin family protein